MTIVSFEEIHQLRQQLADLPMAQKALDTLEDCEGDLADAALQLAIRAGQEPDTDSLEWLTSVAKKCRAALCLEPLRTALEEQNYQEVVRSLMERKLCPAVVATPVLLYVIHQGVDAFCEPLEGMVGIEAQDESN